MLSGSLQQRVLILAFSLSSEELRALPQSVLHQAQRRSYLFLQKKRRCCTMQVLDTVSTLSCSCVKFFTTGRTEVRQHSSFFVQGPTSPPTSVHSLQDMYDSIRRTRPLLVPRTMPCNNSVDVKTREFSKLWTGRHGSSESRLLGISRCSSWLQRAEEATKYRTV
ncbi:hypothetical protein B0H66DRAFT_165798 [Apodospora peruviana]|uniref:Uncharacterized protein n=1 Tax=Apodospora peruviana TaxID=516989 RepID=A0AAE0MBR1_9PEZI|nr:hypothetical protein B0H66DRAFT_165798 [Apodospora peruviana]